MFILNLSLRYLALLHECTFLSHLYLVSIVESVFSCFPKTESHKNLTTVIQAIFPSSKFLYLFIIEILGNQGTSQRI